MEDAIIKGLGLGLLLSLSVGPVVFTILKISLKLGHMPGYAFVVGVSLSDILLVVLGNAAAELLHSLMRYEVLIAASGAILLMMMGAWSLLYGKDPQDTTNDLSIEFRRRDMARFTLQGFFLNILNPAPIFFWITTCTAFAFLPLDERLMLFAGCLATVLGIDLLKVMLAGKIRTLLTPRMLHRLHYISAFVLIGFWLVISVGLIYARLRHH
jgi:threonine/homoserine/homoserine lactone efflux protein